MIVRILTNTKSKNVKNQNLTGLGEAKTYNIATVRRTAEVTIG